MFELALAAWQVRRQRHALEALLLHSRNLRDFLFGSMEEHARGADNFFLAEDLIPGWNPDKGNDNYKVLWRTQEAINAQLSHLSLGSELTLPHSKPWTSTLKASRQL